MDVLQRLLQADLITPEIVSEIESHLDDADFSYERVLLEKGLTREILLQVLADEYGVPSYEFKKDQIIPQEILKYIPEESARYYRIVPLKIEDGVLVIGANDPDNLKVREVLSFISMQYDIACKLVFVFNDDIEKILSSYESFSGEIGEALGSFEVKATKDDEKVEDTKETKEDDFKHIKEDALNIIVGLLKLNMRIKYFII